MSLTILAAAAWAVALCLALHFTLGRRYWLIACLLSSLLYVILSMQLERVSAGPWLLGLRWGLFATALFTFVRYRASRRSP